MKQIKLIAFAIIAIFVAPAAASAADIPLLTWERDRQQQVVFGVGSFPQYWKVQLEDINGQAFPFQESAMNASGFVVFTISIADDFALGSYTVVATGKKAERRTIAGVQVIEATRTTAATSLFDLTAILAIFTFITVLISTIRSRKYASIEYRTGQSLDELSLAIQDPDQSFISRLLSAPYRIRIQSLASIRASLPRFLLIREGELAHRINKHIYSFSPVLGLTAGAFTSMQIANNGGVANLAVVTLLALVLFSIWDALSGIAVTLGFWAVQLITGNVTSARDLLVQLALGIALVGPALFTSLLRDLISKDFEGKLNLNSDSLHFMGVIGAGIVGTGVFYVGHALMTSILYTEGVIRSIGAVHLTVIAVALILRGLADSVVEGRQDRYSERFEIFYVARISSPITALTVFAMTGGFIYIWTNKVGNALPIATLFTLPYLFGFIKPGAWFKQPFKWGRNVLLESALASAIIWVVFRELTHRPILLDQRVFALLLIGGLPMVIHAIYSAIYAAHEDAFTSEDIHGRITT